MKENSRNTNKFNIANQTSESDISKLHRELLGVLDQFYYSVVRVNLLEDTVCVLQYQNHPEIISNVYHWPEYLRETSGVFVESQKSHVLEKLSAAHLLEVYRSGEMFYSIDAPYLKNGILNSMTCFVFFAGTEEAPLAYLMIRNSSREYLRKHIVDSYVYNNCDFFIYLDGKNNRYTLLNSTEGGAFQPPVLYDDYLSAVEKYVNKNVVPGDREAVLQEMSTQQVQSRLEKQEAYSFYYGCIDAKQGYTRKRLDYRYYERNTQMIMVSCTDVTEMYLKEQAHHKALFDALKSAQTDSLTGLLNYKGTIEKISEAIEEKPEHAAFLFIDLDNFKSVNDTFGHDVGDYVLGEVAVLLYEEALENPLIGRIGGDEFIVFFPEISSMEEVKMYAERVCLGIAGMDYGPTEDETHISASIGIAEYPKDGSDYKTLVKKADEMTYQAKFTGKNKYVVYGEVQGCAE